MKRPVKLTVLLVLLGFSLFLNVNFLVPSVRAWIPLEGHITQDTTLAVTTEPYRVVKDVIVDAGVTLTIEPGVTVEFADGLSLIVQGSLTAVGTDATPIVLTSSRSSPSSGVWSTIKFEGNSSEQFTLKHAKVEFAVHGVTVESIGSATIEKSEFTSCSESGIYTSGQNSLEIKDNVFDLPVNGVLNQGGEISGIKVLNNLITTSSNGIQITVTGFQPKISNLTIQGNHIVSNGKGIAISLRAESYGNISDIIIRENQVTAKDNGIHIQARSYTRYAIVGRAYVSDVIIRENQVTAKDGDALFIEAIWMTLRNMGILDNYVTSDSRHGMLVDAPQAGYIQNVTIQNNEAVSCAAYGLMIRADHTGPGAYDALITNNTFSKNLAGVVISLAVKTNITRNSISYNTYGVLGGLYFLASTDSSANFNDIYENSLYGMNVTPGATVNAENNYWGHPTGPYHPSLNPEGKGNRVNGDGTDLDFIPFNSTPFGPIIPTKPLNVSLFLAPTSIGSGSEVTVNVQVTNGTVVVDDVLVQLASDNGGSFAQSSGLTDSDGDFTTTFTAPNVAESTNVKISATASKSGYRDGSDYKYVTVYPPDTLFLSVTVTADPSQVQSGDTSTITVRVTDGTNAVSGASVALSSNKGGSLSLTSGTTDSNGYFTLTYTAPSGTTQTAITITANATKTGYLDGQGETLITVNPGPPPEEDSTLWIYLVILVIILATIVGIVAIARRKRHKPETTEQETQKSTSPPY